MDRGDESICAPEMHLGANRQQAVDALVPHVNIAKWVREEGFTEEMKNTLWIPSHKKARGSWRASRSNPLWLLVARCLGHHKSVSKVASEFVQA